jgi:hypothetical protein
MSASQHRVKYCLITKIAEETGYTPKAIRRKIEDGVLVQGRHYKKAPDGHILIDIEAFNSWVEGNERA